MPFAPFDQNYIQYGRALAVRLEPRQPMDADGNLLPWPPYHYVPMDQVVDGAVGLNPGLNGFGAVGAAGDAYDDSYAYGGAGVLQTAGGGGGSGYLQEGIFRDLTQGGLNITKSILTPPDLVTTTDRFGNSVTTVRNEANRGDFNVNSGRENPNYRMAANGGAGGGVSAQLNTPLGGAGLNVSTTTLLVAAVAALALLLGRK